MRKTNLDHLPQRIGMKFEKNGLKPILTPIFDGPVPGKLAKGACLKPPRT